LPEIGTMALKRRRLETRASGTDSKVVSHNFESERQRFIGLKVLNVTQRVAVNGAARFTAHLELGWKRDAQYPRQREF
jgi:hypothetical protein